MKPEDHRDLVHRLFNGLVKPAELKAKGLPVGGRSNSKPQIKNGAGKPHQTGGKGTWQKE